jgi:peptidoglycan/LPS O-acetylase OafA/YrhL
MPFQSTVNWDLNLGVPGDIILDEPTRITTVTLAAAGYLGYFFTVANNTGLASPGGTITNGSVIFGGIAVLSKDEPLFGSSAANPLNPNLAIEANAQVALLSLGSCIVSIPNAWEEGDYLAYTTATGALLTYAPGGAPGGGNLQVPNAVMVRFGNAATGGGLGIARLTN